MSKYVHKWTTKTLNMSLKYSMCCLAITYGNTYYVSILYLHFPYKTHFCNTHSGWLQLLMAASSGTPKHMTTEIRLTRPRVRRDKWVVVNLRCRRWMFNYNIHIIYLEYYLSHLFGNEAYIWKGQRILNSVTHPVIDFISILVLLLYIWQLRSLQHSCSHSYMSSL